MRNMQKALLYALLLPQERMKAMQESRDFTALMAAGEEAKIMPFGDVWNEYLRREGADGNWLAEVKKYEKEVLSER